MSLMSMRRAKPVAFVLIFTMLWIGMPPAAHAAVIPTGQAIALEEHAAIPSGVAAALAREEVRAQFVALGVAPSEVEHRLAALSDGELARLDHHLAALPAGGDAILGVLGVVLVVLLVLEMVGVIDIFKKF